LHRCRMAFLDQRAAWAALLTSCFLMCLGVRPSAAQAWSEFGLTESAVQPPTDGPEIQEPFFEFLVSMVNTDSLGEWSGEQLREHAAGLDRKSRFPLTELVLLSRKRPDTAVVARYPAGVVTAVWRIVLSGPLDRAMPYSILGYHPGSLRVARELVLSELFLGDVDLPLPQDGHTVHRTVTGTHVLVLEQGFVVLDADGWLDAILGAGLDDAWTLGFVIGREDGRLLGLGVSVGRKGRHIYGEFDFANDQVLAHGRPLASALSRLSRRWLNPADGNLPPPWVEP